MAELNTEVLTALATGGIFLGNNSDSANDDHDSTWDNVSIMAKAMLPIATLGIGCVANYLLDYVLDNVVFQLATLETPVPGGLDSEAVGLEKYGLLDQDETMPKDGKKNQPIQAKPHYVTSSVRATLRHLYREAGDMSMFRGIGAFSTVRILNFPLFFVIRLIVKRIITYEYANTLLSGVLLWVVFMQAYVACDHMIISKPRHKFWFRRLPLTFFGVIRKLWITMAATVIIEESVDWISSKSFSLTNAPSPEHRDNTGLLQLSAGPMVSLPVLTIIWILLKAMMRSQVFPIVKLVLSTPVDTIHNRIQASMLPDEDDPIIPFDRYFDGRPQFGILQQPQEPLDFVRASRTIDQPTFLRILKLNIRCHFIKAFATWCFWALIFAEITFLVGPSAVWVVLKLLTGTPVVQQDLDSLSRASRNIIGNIISANASAPAVDPAFNATSFDIVV